MRLFVGFIFGVLVANCGNSTMDLSGVEKKVTSTNEPKEQIKQTTKKPTKQTTKNCGDLICSRIHKMMRPDQAPPLNRPVRVLPKQAKTLRPSDRIIGVWHKGQARAYPLNILAYHRVVNDVLANDKITVAFSPLTESVFCAKTNQSLFHSGSVYENDDLLTSKEDKALWSVILGRKVTGEKPPKTHKRDTRIPCAVITWSTWQKLRPKTTVIWPKPTQKHFDYTKDPWGWYRRDDKHLIAPLHYVDLRLPYKQPVLGLAAKGMAKAFPLPKTKKAIQNIVFNNSPILIVLDGPSHFGNAYIRHLDGIGTLEFSSYIKNGQLFLKDTRTNSSWNLLGEAVSGKLIGKKLVRPNASTCLFFAWAAFFQGTEIDTRKKVESSNAKRSPHNG